jgi:hypothetical protein
MRGLLGPEVADIKIFRGGPECHILRVESGRGSPGEDDVVQSQALDLVKSKTGKRPFVAVTTFSITGDPSERVLFSRLTRSGEGSPVVRAINVTIFEHRHIVAPHGDLGSGRGGIAGENLALFAEGLVPAIPRWPF